MIVDCSPQFSVNFVAIVRKWEKISSWHQVYVLCWKCLLFFSALLSLPVPMISPSCYSTYLNNQHLIIVLLDLLFFSSSFISVHAPSFWLRQTPPLSLVPEFIQLSYSRCQGTQPTVPLPITIWINAEKIPWQRTAKHHQHSPIPQWMYLNL